MSVASVGVTIVVRARESRVHGEGSQFVGFHLVKVTEKNEDEVPLNIGEIQRRLSLWAELDGERKFYGLYRFLYDMDWLRLAHVRQKTNSHSHDRSKRTLLEWLMGFKLHW